MTQQIAMNLDTRTNGLRWILYIEQEVKGQERMVPLLNDNGEVWFFESYENALIEKSSYPLSVIGTGNPANVQETVYSIVHARNVTRPT